MFRDVRCKIVRVFFPRWEARHEVIGCQKMCAWGGGVSAPDGDEARETFMDKGLCVYMTNFLAALAGKPTMGQREAVGRCG